MGEIRMENTYKPDQHSFPTQQELGVSLLFLRSVLVSLELITQDIQHQRFPSMQGVVNVSHAEAEDSLCVSSSLKKKKSRRQRVS